jgi:uncharacterized Zn-finger protein
MQSIEKLIAAHELEVQCAGCSTVIQRPIAWLREHRDMTCPICETTIILGTSKINAEIRNVERQLMELHRQLTQKFGNSR